MTFYTIGFTQKSAETFFELLKNNGVKKLVDVRINNTSQLAGFAKYPDVKYFVKEICGIPYEHIVDFAPTKELLKGYQQKEVTWDQYVVIYRNLLNNRHILQKYDMSRFDGACFMCSEDMPTQCHRRLLVEFIKESNPDVVIKHLR